MIRWELARAGVAKVSKLTCFTVQMKTGQIGHLSIKIDYTQVITVAQHKSEKVGSCLRYYLNDHN